MAAPTPPQSDATPTQGLIPRHEFGSSSTPTPSRRNRDGVGDGCETDGQWDSSAEAAAASAGESSSEEDCRRNSEIIRARVYEKQAIRHREEREARSSCSTARERVFTSAFDWSLAFAVGPASPLWLRFEILIRLS